MVRPDNFAKGLFHQVEVAEKPLGVELGAGDGGGDAPVVAMNDLTLALEENGVGRAELCLNGEFVHAGV